MTGARSGKTFSKLVSTSLRERVPSPLVSHALNAAFIVIANDVWFEIKASPARNCHHRVLDDQKLTNPWPMGEPIGASE